MGESTPAADPRPPAALLPAPSRRERLAWYALAVVGTAVVLAAGLRLDRISLREPINYDGDVLLIMPMVKATLERGSHWRIERMGYPGVYELHDFPVIDHLHFAVIWVIGRVVSDWVVVFNLYHLLTWPLTTLTAMWAFRRLGLSLPFAAAGGVLYAFLPYHYLRGESHYFLAAYWVIPLSWLPALDLLRGDLPFFRRRPDGGLDWALKTRGTAWQVVLAAATASAGAYYAFFACAVYAAAGAYGWAAHRTWKAAASGAVLAGLVVVFGIVNHLPAVVHAVKYGRNTVTERFAQESEMYGMKFAQLVLPIDSHNLTAFSRVKAAYSIYPQNNENGCAPLGAVGALGLLGLLGVLVVPNRLGWPYRPLAAMALFILLFSTIGGFGAIFNLVLFDQIRCYNRFSVYLAFICLFASLWALDTYLAADPGRRRYHAWAAVAITAVGIADQTPTQWFTHHVVNIVERDASRFRADRDFFARVEEQAPGARVMCIPYIPFPEVPNIHGMGTYEHSRVYLHTATLIAGYAPIKFREADEWLRSLAFEHKSLRVRRWVASGFDGVLVDGRGFLTAEDGNRVVNEIREAIPDRVPLPKVIHEDGKQVFLDLRPYRDWEKTNHPAAFERYVQHERERVALCWIRGFPSPEGYGREHFHRLGYRSAAFQFVNPSNRDRTFEFAATFDTEYDGVFRVRLSCPGLVEDEFEIGGSIEDDPRRPGGRRWVHRFVIPPGRHTVRVTCTPPPKFILGDTRPICYYLQDIEFKEIP